MVFSIITNDESIKVDIHVNPETAAFDKAKKLREEIFVLVEKYQAASTKPKFDFPKKEVALE